MTRQSLIENQRFEDFGRGNSLKEEARVGAMAALGYNQL